MTEQTTDAPKPPGFGLLNVNRRPYPNPDALTRGDFSAEQIKTLVASSEADLIARGRYKPEEVRAVFDVMYGLFRADNKERATQIRQETAAHIAFALSRTASPNHTASMFEVVRVNDQIAQSPYGKSEGLSPAWSHIRAQCGLINTLRSAGMRVSIPSDTPGAKESRVVAWSILGQTDIVTRKGEETALVQVTGSQDNDITTHRQMWGFNEVPVQLQAFLRALGKGPKDSFPHISLTIPDFGSLNWSIPEDPKKNSDTRQLLDSQQALKSHLTLKPEVQRRILDAIIRENQ